MVATRPQCWGLIGSGEDCGKLENINLSEGGITAANRGLCTAMEGCRLSVIPILKISEETPEMKISIRKSRILNVGM